jgi:hypothetical protein
MAAGCPTFDACLSASDAHNAPLQKWPGRPACPPRHPQQRLVVPRNRSTAIVAHPAVTMPLNARRFSSCAEVPCITAPSAVSAWRLLREPSEPARCREATSVSNLARDALWRFRPTRSRPMCAASGTKRSRCSLNTRLRSDGSLCANTQPTEVSLSPASCISPNPRMWSADAIGKRWRLN